MSAVHLTATMVKRTVHVIDSSGIVDLLLHVSDEKRGRIANKRTNLRLILIGVHLCTRLGQDATIANVHRVLTTALTRDEQWELGVLRPRSASGRRSPSRRQANRPENQEPLS